MLLSMLFLRFFVFHLFVLTPVYFEIFTIKIFFCWKEDLDLYTLSCVEQMVENNNPFVYFLALCPSFFLALSLFFKDLICTENKIL